MHDSLIQNDMNAPAWKGGDVPYKASYGKLMMWFFLITDTLTFSAFLAGYGFSRFKYQEKWPVPEDVFTHFPFLEGNHPLLFVALMTFILIMSSVTMVLAVNYGHKMQKNKVILWLSLTIVGGILFLSSQAGLLLTVDHRHLGSRYDRKRCLPERLTPRQSPCPSAWHLKYLSCCSLKALAAVSSPAVALVFRAPICTRCETSMVFHVLCTC